MKQSKKIGCTITGLHPIASSLLLSTVLVVVPATTLASDTTAVLIGGGYDIHGSQGQIELNVKWVQGVLEQQNADVHTFFTDGNETGLDVHYNLAANQRDSALEPLARVFGDWVLENRRYRENTVADVSGSTRRTDLEPSLRTLIDESADQDLLLVYNGHGSQSFTTPDHVTLNLWDNTTITANELHSLIKPRKSPFKFIFTQCYSGGFHRLAYDNPSRGLALANSPRCGFTAESAYRLAEGCSASIETDDYRDYTTYFFSALSGYERNGDIISHDPDLNRDGVTSLREAHLFTLEEAFSTDLSRSTSEDYLTQWQPWYLRWLPGQKNLPNNEYSRIFRELAERHDIELTDSIVTDIRQKLSAVDDSINQLMQQRYGLRNQTLELQLELQTTLVDQWPSLLGPYTGAYQAMARSGELLSVSNELASNATYKNLKTLQDQDYALDDTLLQLEREATQYQKLLRMRHLSVLQQQLAEYGSEQEKNDYQSLLSCEESPLTTQ